MQLFRGKISSKQPSSEYRTLVLHSTNRRIRLAAPHTGANHTENHWDGSLSGIS